MYVAAHVYNTQSHTHEQTHLFEYKQYVTTTTVTITNDWVIKFAKTIRNKLQTNKQTVGQADVYFIVVFTVGVCWLFICSLVINLFEILKTYKQLEEKIKQIEKTNDDDDDINHDIKKTTKNPRSM